jgi:glucose/arabinose dehydrogenase
VALRDTDGNYTADRTTYFGDGSGTGIGLHGGSLHVGTDTAIWRYEHGASELVPSGKKEPIVGGFPKERQHAVKPCDVDGHSHLYVNVGAPQTRAWSRCGRRARPARIPVRC